MRQFLQIFNEKIRQLNCNGYKNLFERRGFFGFRWFLVLSNAVTMSFVKDDSACSYFNAV
nr:hypothetical protein [uncultured Flavobacterium sp.]